MIREPIGGNKTRSVVEERRGECDHSLTDDDKPEALLDKASNPKSNSCTNDPDHDTYTKAVFVESDD